MNSRLQYAKQLGAVPLCLANMLEIYDFLLQHGTHSYIRNVTRPMTHYMKT